MSILMTRSLSPLSMGHWRTGYLQAGVLPSCLCALQRQHLPLTIEASWVLAGLARGEVHRPSCIAGWLGLVREHTLVFSLYCFRYMVH